MKKQQKSYAVNNQEDEDGYTLYPENATGYENEKTAESTSSAYVPTDKSSGNLQSRKFILPPSSMLRRINKK